MEFVKSRSPSADEQIHLFTKAQEVARQHKEWRTLTKMPLPWGNYSGKVINSTKPCSISTMPGSLQKQRTILIHSEQLSFIGNSLFFGKEGFQKRFSDTKKSWVTWKNLACDTLKSGAMLGWCYVICGRVSRGLGMIEPQLEERQSLSS